MGVRIVVVWDMAEVDLGVVFGVHHTRDKLELPLK